MVHTHTHTTHRHTHTQHTHTGSYVPQMRSCRQTKPDKGSNDFGASHKIAKFKQKNKIKNKKQKRKTKHKNKWQMAKKEKN